MENEQKLKIAIAEEFVGSFKKSTEVFDEIQKQAARYILFGILSNMNPDNVRIYEQTRYGSICGPRPTHALYVFDKDNDIEKLECELYKATYNYMVETRFTTSKEDAMELFNFIVKRSQYAIVNSPIDNGFKAILFLLQDFEYKIFSSLFSDKVEKDIKLSVITSSRDEEEEKEDDK